MNTGDSLKVYLSDEVVDLRGKSDESKNVTTDQNQPRKGIKSSTELNRHRRIVEQRKLGNPHETNSTAQTSRTAQSNIKPPLRRPLTRTNSVDSRFRRFRTISPEKKVELTEQTVTTTLINHYSVSDPSFTSRKIQNNIVDFPPDDGSPHQFSKDRNKNVVNNKGNDVQVYEQELNKTMELDAEEPDLSPSPALTETEIPKETQIVRTQSKVIFVDAAEKTLVDYITTIGDMEKATKSSSTSDIIGNYDTKRISPMSKYWDDPRLLTKYNGFMQPVCEIKSMQTLQDTLVEYQDEPSDSTSPRECWKCNRRKSINTYKFDNEETDRASSMQSKHTYLEQHCSRPCNVKFLRALQRSQGKLFWVFYFIGCGLGVFVATFVAWLVLEKDILGLFQGKTTNQTNFIDMLQHTASHVIGSIFYYINRTIETLANLLLVY